MVRKCVPRAPISVVPASYLLTALYSTQHALSFQVAQTCNYFALRYLDCNQSEKFCKSRASPQKISNLSIFSKTPTKLKVNLFASSDFKTPYSLFLNFPDQFERGTCKGFFFFNLILIIFEKCFNFHNLRSSQEG